MNDGVPQLHKESKDSSTFLLLKPVFQVILHISICLLFPAVRITFSLQHFPTHQAVILYLKHPNFTKMQFSITAVLFGLVALSAAAITDVEGVRNTPRAEIDTRQAANGACCIPNKSLKQDGCTVDGSAGKCVPGGPAACK